MKTVEERLAELEGRVRRWQGMTMALALVLVAGVVMAAAKPDVAEVMRCRSLEVVDDSGKWVVNLDAWVLGGRIDVRNSEGKRTTTISQSDNHNGILKVYSRDGKNLVYAGAGKANSNGLLNVLSREGEVLI